MILFTVFVKISRCRAVTLLQLLALALSQSTPDTPPLICFQRPLETFFSYVTAQADSFSLSSRVQVGLRALANGKKCLRILIQTRRSVSPVDYFISWVFLRTHTPIVGGKLIKCKRKQNAM